MNGRILILKTCFTGKAWLLVLSSLMVTANAPAANWAWSTAPGSLNFADNNWTNSTTAGPAAGTPASGDSLYFGVSSVTNLNNNDTSFTFAGITFNSDAGSFLITNKAFTLTGGITNKSALAQTVRTPITFSGNETFINGTGAALTIGTNLTGAGNLTLNANSSGAISLGTTLAGGIGITGSITNSGTGSGAVNIGGVGGGTPYVGSTVTGIVQNSPTSALTVFGNNTTYTGGVTANAGTISLLNSSSAGGAGGFILVGGTSGSAAASVFTGSGANDASPITVRAGSSGVKTVGYNSGGGTTMTFSGNLTVNDDVTLLQASGNSSVGVVFSGASISVAAGKTITLQSGNAASSQLTISGPVSSADASSKIILSAGGARLSAANTFSGTVQTLPNSGALALNNVNAVQNATLDTGAVVGTQSVTFSVAGANTYNIGALQGADDLAIGANTVSVGGKAVDTTFGGIISGTGGSLTKVGVNSLTLSGANTYDGNTTINNGKLVGVVGGSSSSPVSVAATAGNNAALGILISDNTKQWTTPTLTVNNAGVSSTLDFNFGVVAPSTSVAPLNISGAANFTTTPAVTVELQAYNVVAATSYPLMTYASSSGTAPTAVTITTAARDTVTGHLTVTGSGPFTLNLVIDSAVSTEPVSWATGNGTWDVNNSGNNVWKNSAAASTYYQLGDTVVFDNTVGSGGTVTLNTTVSPIAVSVNPTTSYTISGNGSIAGVTAITKTGSGALTLATTNTYSGGTLLSTGQLNINNGGSTSASSAIGTGPFTIAGTSTIDNTSSGDVTLLPAIVENWNADFTYAGSVNNLNLGIGPVILGGNRQIAVAAHTLAVGGAISDGGSGYSLTKTGNGTLTLLNNSSSYSGGTVINAGAVNTGVAGGLGTGAVTVNVNGTLNLTAGSTTYTGPNAGMSGAGTVNITTGSGSQNVFLSGANSGFTGVLNVGTNSAGGKVVLNGTLDSSAKVNVLSNSTVFVQSGFAQPASITLYGGDTGESAGQLRVEGEWSGPVSLAGPITGAGDGTVGANTAFIGTISGNISGSQPLIKVGAGTIVLSGTNTYTGNTIVSVGTLIVVNTNSLPGSTVSVANGAVLQLNFAETNQVAGLVLGGTNQAPGVYSAATSSPFIAGTGSLLVASPVATNPTNIIVSVSGSTLTLSWPADHLGWTLQAQTNSLATGLGTNWVDVPGSTSVNSVTNTMSPANGAVFYRLKY